MGGSQTHKYFIKENIKWRINNRLNDVTEMKKFLHYTKNNSLNLKNTIKRDSYFSSSNNLVYALIIDSRKTEDRFTMKMLINNFKNNK